MLYACNSGYTKQDGKWVWISYDEAVGKRINEIDEHDFDTFEILDNEKYAKDKNKVFFIGRTIKGANPESFQILGNGYSKDANHVFLDAEIVVLADPNSFERLEFPYSKDNNHVFCGTIPLEIDKNEVNEFIVTNENHQMSASKSTLSVQYFIQANSNYKWLDTVNVDRIIVGEWGTGQTHNRKFKGFKEVK